MSFDLTIRVLEAFQDMQRAHLISIMVIWVAAFTIGWWLGFSRGKQRGFNRGKVFGERNMYLPSR